MYYATPIFAKLWPTEADGNVTINERTILTNEIKLTHTKTNQQENCIRWNHRAYYNVILREGCHFQSLYLQVP